MAKQTGGLKRKKREVVDGKNRGDQQVGHRSVVNQG